MKSRHLIRLERRAHSCTLAASRPSLAPLGSCLSGASEEQWEATGRGGAYGAHLCSPARGTSAAGLPQGKK